MPSCNDSIGTFCAWWILMKYSAQISLWWLYLFYSKVKEDFLERSGIRIMLMLLCNKFENLCGYFSCWKEKALRSCNDGLLQLFGNKSIKRVSADEKQIGFMHLIDSAESKGSLYTREIFDYAIQPIKQGTCNLLHKACIVSCNVKKNAKSNLEIIKKFIYNLFLRKFIWFKQKAMLAYNFAIDIIKMIAESIRKYCTLVVEFIKNTYNSDKVIAVRNTIWRTRETILYTMNTFVSAGFELGAGKGHFDALNPKPRSDKT
ncbi:hypothetical protein O3M35_006478 [Rhynocoris fuscipes]|uniref:Uncharacterized protein n=1 Tax=Rhynocoris fuscipes TaxID=488301 RepID=A0AAW1DHB6_9HEMI